MILGRSPALWLALVAAVLNAAVIVAGISLTSEQVGVLNILAGAIVGIVANETNPTTAGTFALTTAATPPDVAGPGPASPTNPVA